MPLVVTENPVGDGRVGDGASDRGRRVEPAQLNELAFFILQQFGTPDTTARDRFRCVYITRNKEHTGVGWCPCPLVFPLQFSLLIFYKQP